MCDGLIDRYIWSNSIIRDRNVESVCDDAAITVVSDYIYRNMPTSPIVGAPLNVRVMASKDNHAGNAPPPASCAEWVRVSPTSISANVFAGN